MAMRASLEALDVTRKVSFFGTGLHALLESDADPDVVVRALADKGVGDASVEVIEATLEDVFLAAAEQGMDEGAP